MTLAHAATRPPVAAGRIMRNSLIAGVAAAVANIVVLLAGNAVIDGSVRVTESPGSSTYTDLGAGQAAVATLISALLAGAVYAALARFAPARARTIFLGVSAVALLLSFGGPLGLDIPGSQQAVLSAMHVVAAAIIVAVVPRSRA